MTVDARAAPSWTKRRLLAIAIGALSFVLGFGAVMFFVMPGRSACLPFEEDEAVQPGEATGGVYRFLTDTFGPMIGYPLSHVRWRRGYLEGDPAFRARLIEILQPFDIVLVKNGYKLTDRIIPGIFGHAAVWLGDEARLREMKLWEHPSVVPLRAEIQAGRALAEAVPGGSALVGIEEVVDSDRLAIVRVRPPETNVDAWRRDLATLVVGQIRQAYDYGFDVDSRERLSCAELVYRAFGDVAWETHLLFGRRTILPDDIVRHALSELSGVDLVAYFTGAPDGSWQEEPTAALAAELEAECGD